MRTDQIKYRRPVIILFWTHTCRLLVRTASVRLVMSMPTPSCVLCLFVSPHPTSNIPGQFIQTVEMMKLYLLSPNDRLWIESKDKQLAQPGAVTLYDLPLSSSSLCPQWKAFLPIVPPTHVNNTSVPNPPSRPKRRRKSSYEWNHACDDARACRLP